MTMDEHIVECVLSILENKRVSDKIYEIVNKFPDFTNTSTSVTEADMDFSVYGGENSLENQGNIRNTILSYKDNNIKLKQICSEQEEKLLKIEADNKTLMEKNSQLNSKLSDYQQLCTENEQMKKDYACLQEELEKKRQEFVQQQNQYAGFDVPLAMLNLYKSLPEELKTRNLNFISERTVFAFVSTGIMNLERFWDFIKEEYLAGRTEYLEQLKRIFDFFFDMKNESGQVYSRNECSIGENFNSEKHIMVLGGKNLSTVAEVFFLGFSDNKGKIIRKTIVKVND